MRIVRSPSAMQRLALEWKRSGRRVGFVPTMGYLHDGHLSLVRDARRRVGKAGIVVASIYVNPTQFAPTEDLSRYPRDWARDIRMCREQGVDVVFAPKDGSMYPAGHSTHVTEDMLSRGMEGASRPTHFRGVTTVVAKLFNLVQPDIAVFGAKDWQQAAVVRRMVADLDFPVKIVVAPTRRESDGLAMSSRNAYLTPAQRGQAVVLSRAIGEARAAVKGARRPLRAESLKARLGAMISGQPEARIDYIEFFEPTTLEPVADVVRGTHLALAVRFGGTRLIDNGRM